MADSEDMKRLTSGEKDLSRCDFREANLAGMDLRGRNFTHCLFEKSQCQGTDFRNCDFRYAKVSFMNASGANFESSNIQNLHFGYTILSGCNFSNVLGNGARFQHVQLSNSDMRGASFLGGSIDADTDLTGVLIDDRSNFDRVKVLRSTSRNPLFYEYEFNNGLLIRRAVDQAEEAARPQLASAANPFPSPATNESFLSNAPDFAAPASDRTVKFNHNDPDHVAIADQISEAVEIVRTTNEYIDDRDSAIKSLSYLSSLWGRYELTPLQVKIGIIMTIDDAIALLSKVTVILFIEVIKKSIVDYLRKNFNI